MSKPKHSTVFYIQREFFRIGLLDRMLEDRGIQSCCTSRVLQNWFSQWNAGVWNVQIEAFSRFLRTEFCKICSLDGMLRFGMSKSKHSIVFYIQSLAKFVLSMECWSLECPNRSIQSWFWSRVLQKWSSRWNAGFWNVQIEAFSRILHPDFCNIGFLDRMLGFGVSKSKHSVLFYKICFLDGMLKLGMSKSKHSILFYIQSFAKLMFSMECWGLECPNQSIRSGFTSPGVFQNWFSRWNAAV